MEPLVETIIQLESTERRTWLVEHYPALDRALIGALQTAAQNIESDDSRKARSIAHLVATAAELWDDRQTLAAALRIEAQTLRAAEPQTAVRKYQEAMRIYQECGQEQLATEAAVGLVAALRNLGKVEEAWATNLWVIAQFRATDERFSLARALLNQGLLAYFRGHFTLARAHYAEAYTLFQVLDQGQWCAAVDTNDANVLEELNDFTAAAAKYQAAHAYYVAANLANAAARVAHNLAYLHFSLGDYQQALRLFADVRDQFAAQESAIDVAFVDLYRVEIYLALNLWHKALDLAQAARPAFERAQMPWETAQLLINEAIAFSQLAKPELALEQFGQARRLLAQHDYGLWQAVVDLYESHLYLRLRNYEAAETTAQQAYQTFQANGLTRRIAQCTVLLGQIAFARGYLDQALGYYAEAKACTSAYSLPAVSYPYHFGLGRVYQRQGKTHAAYAHYRQAIAAIEQVQSKIGAEDYKLAFLSNKLEVYEEFIGFCLRQSEFAAAREAFETLERAKVVTLQHMQPRAAAQDATAAHEVNQQQIDQLKRELNRYYTQFHTPEADFATPTEATRLQKAITYSEQRLTTLLETQRQPDRSLPTTDTLLWLNVPALQATLPPATLILTYFVKAESVTIFCVTADDFEVYQAPLSAAHLSGLLQQFGFQLGKFRLGAAFYERHSHRLQQSVDTVLYTLYQALIAPVAEHLAAVDHVIIVPHKQLCNLPFHALFDGKRYLLEKVALSYAFSATFQHRVRAQPYTTPQNGPLILGVNDDLIQHAEQEATAVAQVFPEATLYVGQAATVARLSEPTAPHTFMHLATHGVFRSDNPVFSALKLADGWVTLQELSMLRSTAPLITLSACHTGRSELGMGDCLTGFAQSFFRTGAQSLVASLWALDDQIASRAMMRFYQQLQAGAPVYQALRTAQLATLATRRHPYFWAPFMLTGNPYLTLQKQRRPFALAAQVPNGKLTIF